MEKLIHYKEEEDALFLDICCLLREVGIKILMYLLVAGICLRLF